VIDEDGDNNTRTLTIVPPSDSDFLIPDEMEDSEISGTHAPAQAGTRVSRRPGVSQDYWEIK
jgi:hypothetical protein